jgi:hypothetical protein
MATAERHRLIYSPHAALHEIETVSLLMHSIGRLVEAGDRHYIRDVEYLSPNGWSEWFRCACGHLVPPGKTFDEHVLAAARTQEN